ncbi:MAG TPA: ATP-binding cassette domain-containing protein [Tenericutes bacterium]|nr:ATP-binding cassette domain-containing protein [Mycoplasmatota bacterium]
MEIRFNNVSYEYKGIKKSEKKAIDNISLEIKKNKINCIIGPSGSGKTTLMELVNALLIPTDGKINVGKFVIDKNKKNINVKELRFNVGLIFEFPEQQFFKSTVKKEIEFGLKQYEYKLKNIDKRISDSLLMVGLNDSFLNRNPFTLSNGEMRKVAIASVLALNPKVIIFDEPTVGLDDASKNNLLKILRMLKTRYKKTIIVVTHDVDALHKIADHIFVLNDGKVILEGDKYEVFKEVDLLQNYKIKVPKIIEFSHKVFKSKNIKMGYRDEINDLIKDIYRHVK